MSIWKKRDWKPRNRAGGIYCAPACGGNCKRSAFELARARGKALAERLGKGWTVRVHENLGWYYNVQSPDGHMRVCVDHWVRPGRPERVSYTAFLGEKNGIGGRWAEHGRTPEAAIRKVLAVASAELGRITELVENFRQAERVIRAQLRRAA